MSLACGAKEVKKKNEEEEEEEGEEEEGEREREKKRLKTADKTKDGRKFPKSWILTPPCRIQLNSKLGRLWRRGVGGGCGGRVRGREWNRLAIIIHGWWWRQVRLGMNAALMATVLMALMKKAEIRKRRRCDVIALPMPLPTSRFPSLFSLENINQSSEIDC